MRGRGLPAGLAILVFTALAIASPAPQAPSLDEIANAAVTDIGDTGTIQLRNGAFEGAPYVDGGAARPIVSLWRELSVHGDLDSAAGEERAVLLSSTTGGSGERIYLAVFDRAADGQIRNIATLPVGDRVKLRAFALDSATLVLDLIEPAPGEAACCGTRLVRRSYRVEHSGLLLVDDEIQGQLSLSTISGHEWILLERNGETLADGLRAPTIRISEAKASGFSGCNEFHVRLEEVAPGEIRIDTATMVSTRMACAESAMALESSFLAELSAVDRYTFLRGHLALGWQRGENRGLLLFRK